VKTGTSKDMRDNWCIGYSSRFTVGVWVGNFSGEPMWDVSGVSGAAPVWHEIMQYLHRRDMGRAPRPPSGVTSLTVSYAEDTEPARGEWFVRGTEMPVVKSAARAAGERIGYPGNGTIIALDPDIPEDRQRVFFETRARTGVGWVLDGEPLAPKAIAGGWDPTPGSHRLTLTDQAGRELDAVSFLVRGARH
jgi:penicillin-binding protein 1C